MVKSIEQKLQRDREWWTTRYAKRQNNGCVLCGETDGKGVQDDVPSVPGQADCPQNEVA
jgi:hypothetical protein